MGFSYFRSRFILFHTFTFIVDLFILFVNLIVMCLSIVSACTSVQEDTAYIFHVEEKTRYILCPEGDIRIFNIDYLEKYE